MLLASPAAPDRPGAQRRSEDGDGDDDGDDDGEEKISQFSIYTNSRSTAQAAAY